MDCSMSSGVDTSVSVWKWTQSSHTDQHSLMLFSTNFRTLQLWVRQIRSKVNTFTEPSELLDVFFQITRIPIKCDPLVWMLVRTQTCRRPGPEGEVHDRTKGATTAWLKNYRLLWTEDRQHKSGQLWTIDTWTRWGWQRNLHRKRQELKESKQQRKILTNINKVQLIVYMIL